jgi:hypothetical protein
MDNSDTGRTNESCREEGKPEKKEKCKSAKHSYGRHHSGAIYGMGFIGAAVYFISNAATFWMGVLGFIKAIFWPAVVVYGLLKYLGM